MLFSFGKSKSIIGLDIGSSAVKVVECSPKGKGVELQSGMTIALEPMLLAGDSRVRVLDDHWTVVSADGRLTAHHEHTISVADGSADVLTRP